MCGPDTRFCTARDPRGRQCRAGTGALFQHGARRHCRGARGGRASAALYDEARQPALWGWVAYMAGVTFVRLGLFLQYRSRTVAGGFAELRPRRWETMMLVAPPARALAGVARALGASARKRARGRGARAGGRGGGHRRGRCAAASPARRSGSSGRRSASSRSPSRSLAARAASPGAVLLLAFFGALLMSCLHRRHAQLLAVLGARAQNEQLLVELRERRSNRARSPARRGTGVRVGARRHRGGARRRGSCAAIANWRRSSAIVAARCRARSTRVLYRNESEWREAMEYVNLDLANAGLHDAEREFYRRDGTRDLVSLSRPGGGSGRSRRAAQSGYSRI